MEPYFKAAVINDNNINHENENENEQPFKSDLTCAAHRESQALINFKSCMEKERQFC